MNKKTGFTRVALGARDAAVGPVAAGVGRGRAARAVVAGGRVTAGVVQARGARRADVIVRRSRAGTVLENRGVAT